MSLLFPSALTQNSAGEHKKAAREQFSGIKSSHLSEAIASGFGYQSHAALLAALGSNARPRSNFSLIGFGKRLTELGYERPADFLADQDVPWAVQCLVSLMIEAGFRDSLASNSSRIGVTKTIDALNVAGCTEFNFKALGRQAQQQQTRALRELFSTVIELQVSVRDGDRVLRSPIVREVGIETPTNCILFSLADVIVRAARLAA